MRPKLARSPQFSSPPTQISSSIQLITNRSRGNPTISPPSTVATERRCRLRCPAESDIVSKPPPLSFGETTAGRTGDIPANLNVAPLQTFFNSDCNSANRGPSQSRLLSAYQRSTSAPPRHTLAIRIAARIKPACANAATSDACPSQINATTSYRLLPRQTGAMTRPIDFRAANVPSVDPSPGRGNRLIKSTSNPGSPNK